MSMLATQREGYSTCGFVVSNMARSEPQLLVLERKMAAMRAHLDAIWSKRQTRFGSRPRTEGRPIGTDSGHASVRPAWRRLVSRIAGALGWLRFQTGWRRQRR
jgi:hypothetical protein